MLAESGADAARCKLGAFLDLADGVDDETWRHHLEAHHCSAWIEDAIGDAELAREVRQVEAQHSPAADTRALIRAAIETPLYGAGIAAMSAAGTHAALAIGGRS